MRSEYSAGEGERLRLRFTELFQKLGDIIKNQEIPIELAQVRETSIVHRRVVFINILCNLKKHSGNTGLYTFDDVNTNNKIKYEYDFSSTK
ncbi:MAG: hypothetical protein ACTH56_04280 [Pseudoalteromonas sp.]